MITNYFKYVLQRNQEIHLKSQKNIKHTLGPWSDYTRKKMKFSTKNFFSKCDQICCNFVTFTKEILNRKLYFL